MNANDRDRKKPRRRSALKLSTENALDSMKHSKEALDGARNGGALSYGKRRGRNI
jgi:hypothetical protein